MNELKVEYKTTPALITTNIGLLREVLAKELENYDVVVTADTVTAAKKLAAELNKVKANIDAARKDLVAQASEPIKAADADMKSLMAMCTEGRSKLVDQIAEFDRARAEEARAAVEAYILKRYDEREVRVEFRTLRPEGFVKISALTAAGNLTAGAKRAIEDGISDCVAAQDRRDARVQRLASLSKISGLETPLTQADVAHILDTESEQEYDQLLNQILQREVDREAAARAKAVADQSQPKAPAEAEPPAAVEPEPVHTPEPPPAQPQRADGRVPVRVTCVFETSVPPGTPAQSIERELRRVLQEAGIKTLTNVFVEQAATEKAA
jgi:hypothetical protein